jgi:LPS sulfotransferase NodH
MSRITIMFHVGRSGSHVLGDLLNQHDKIDWEGEIFERLFREFEKRNNKIIGENDISIDIGDFIKTKFSGQTKEVYGIEVKFFHLALLHKTIDQFLDLFKDQEVHYIILKRKNLLRKIISSLVAHETSVFHIPVENKAKLKKITIDVNSVRIDRDNKTLMKFLTGYSESFEELELALKDKKVLHLVYEEDIEQDPLKAYRKVCEFIGVEPSQPVINFRRSNPFKVSRIIRNFREVRKYLKDSPFESMTKG